MFIIVWWVILTTVLVASDSSVDSCADGGSCAAVGADRICVDESDQCDAWAKLGECETHPAYMRLSCR
jgi:hypothetical protein